MIPLWVRYLLMFYLGFCVSMLVTAIWTLLR